VRPAHGLVALHGADVVPVTALGLKAGRTTHGPPLRSRGAGGQLQHADSYAAAAARRRRGDRQLCRAPRRDRAPADAAAAAKGLKPIDDDALLDEVTALVERPNVLLCRFEDPSSWPCRRNA
jgi:glycyl-tRNA synthetase beta chain